jgi:GNAT superfamily N-acetyltransferase
MFMSTELADVPADRQPDAGHPTPGRNGAFALPVSTRAEDEGGYRLVAAVSGPEDALVAEAGYAILPDGDGEFAFTVAPGWRGWRLGRYLLDAIVAAAAGRGVPNLHQSRGDILRKWQ